MSEVHYIELRGGPSSAQIRAQINTVLEAHPQWEPWQIESLPNVTIIWFKSREETNGQFKGRRPKR